MSGAPANHSLLRLVILLIAGVRGYEYDDRLAKAKGYFPGGD